MHWTTIDSTVMHCTRTKFTVQHFTTFDSTMLQWTRTESKALHYIRTECTVRNYTTILYFRFLFCSVFNPTTLYFVLMYCTILQWLVHSHIHCHISSSQLPLDTHFHMLKRTHLCLKKKTFWYSPQSAWNGYGSFLVLILKKHSE